MPFCSIRPPFEQDHAIGHRHRLDLVVRDVHHRDAELALQRADLLAHLGAQLRVEVRQRLVHQAHRRLVDDRAAERHALLLAAGELRRLAVEQRVEAEQVGHSREPRDRIRPADTLRTRRPNRMFSATVRCGNSA